MDPTPILTFEAELTKASPGSRLGIDIVLFSSEHGGGLVVERVHDGGQVQEWNRQSQEPHRIRPGDFIVRVNGVEGDVSALAEELRVGKDLSFTVHRPRLADSMLPSQVAREQEAWQLACGGGGGGGGGGMQGMDPPTMNRVMPLNVMQGMNAGGGARPFGGACPAGLGQRAGATGPGPGNGNLQSWSAPAAAGDGTGNQLEDCGAAIAQRQMAGGWRPGGLGQQQQQQQPQQQQQQQPRNAGNGNLTFEVVLNKHAGMRLGIDVLPSTWELGGVMVKRVAGSGAVAAWNQSHPEAMGIQTGDVIVYVNGVSAGFDQMMEELRNSQEMRIVVMRPSSNQRLTQNAPNVLDLGSAPGVQSAGPMDFGGAPGLDGPMPKGGFEEMKARGGWRDDGGDSRGPAKLALAMPGAGRPTGPPYDGPPMLPQHMGGTAPGAGGPLQADMQACDGQDALDVPSGVGSDGQSIWFTVQLEKPVGVRLGIVIKLTNDNLVVESVPEGGCVADWNRRSQPPYRVQPGDFIVQVNGVRQWQSLHRIVEEFARECKQVTLTVQRAVPRNSPPSALGQTIPGAIGSQVQVGDEARLQAQRRGVAPGLRPERPHMHGHCANGAGVPARPPLSQGMIGGDGGGLGDQGIQSLPLSEAGLHGQPLQVPTQLGSGKSNMCSDAQGALAALGGLQDGGCGWAPSRSPVNLLRSMLDLNDQDLGRVLRFMLERRPWLREPVAKAIGRVEEESKMIGLQ